MYACSNFSIDTVKEREEAIQVERYEMTKPLGRYADDKDLTEHQKSARRAEDPMAAYFKEKEQKKAKKRRKEKLKRGIVLRLISFTY